MAIASANAEWASVAAEESAFQALHGFAGVWGNRLVRAGIGIGAAAGGLAGLQAGAAIGAAIGLVGGPAAVLTGIVGGLIGLGVGIAVKPLGGLVGRMFLGRDGVLRKRRAQVAAQVGPILDEVSAKYSDAIASRLDALRHSVADERARSDGGSATLERVSARWAQHSESLRKLIRDLDRDTTTALLRIAGRERLARSVKRSTRVPGLCIVTELESKAFWEAWFFPPDVGERIVAGKASSAGGEAAGSLAYALGLVDVSVRLIRANSASATLLIEEDIPTTIAKTWADALTEHIGRHIGIKVQWKAAEA